MSQLLLCFSYYNKLECLFKKGLLLFHSLIFGKTNIFLIPFSALWDLFCVIGIYALALYNCTFALIRQPDQCTTISCPLSLSWADAWQLHCLFSSFILCFLLCVFTVFNFLCVSCFYGALAPHFQCSTNCKWKIN